MKFRRSRLCRKRFLYSHPARFNQPARPFSMRVEPVSPVDSSDSDQPPPEETQKYITDDSWVIICPSCGHDIPFVFQRNEEVERGN